MQSIRRRKDFANSEFKNAMNIRRGDIYYADLSPVIGSEQGGLRPVLIVQNDIGNRYSPTVIAAAITSRMGKTRLPTHIDVFADKVGLAKDSVILLEQVRTLDKKRLKERMGHLDDIVMQKVNDAISISFGLNESPQKSFGGDARVYTGASYHTTKEAEAQKEERMETVALADAESNKDNLLNSENKNGYGAF
jgi:mRNA interferase MazF